MTLPVAEKPLQGVKDILIEDKSSATVITKLAPAIIGGVGEKTAEDYAITGDLADRVTPAASSLTTDNSHFGLDDDSAILQNKLKQAKQKLEIAELTVNNSSGSEAETLKALYYKQKISNEISQLEAALIRKNQGTFIRLLA